MEQQGKESTSNSRESQNFHSAPGSFLYHTSCTVVLDYEPPRYMQHFSVPERLIKELAEGSLIPHF